MKLVTFAATAVAVLAWAGAAGAASKTLDLQSFSKLEISSGIDARITIGTTQSVIADSPYEEQLEELRVEVSDGRLKAWVDWNIFDLLDFAGIDRQIVLTITVPVLTEINANSGADVDAAGIGGDAIVLRASSGADLDIKGALGKSYDIDASSGSDVDIEGTCSSAKIVSSSGSNVRADKLLCLDVDANASSGSDLDVYASASVKADASSGSDITVHGKPAQTAVQSSSGGDITVED
jgi:hypothetical protein